MSTSTSYLSVQVDLDRPVLICGVGRSGTSLLQSMMNAHPDLCFPPETHFFRRYVTGQDPQSKWDKTDREQLEVALGQDEEFSRAGISSSALLQNPLSASGPAGVFRALLQQTAIEEGKHRVGDKDPKNIDSLRELKLAFPRAHVIHVIRDPRDVLLSRMKAAWSAQRPWWMHPLIYREQLRRGKALGRTLFGARYLEVIYEDLIRSPQQTLQRVCQHVDLPWRPEMLAFGDSAAKLVDAKEMSWKQETLGPLLSKNSGKWRGQLTMLQVAVCEEVCREAFEEHGYEFSLPRNPLLRLASSAVRDTSSLLYDFKLRRGPAR
jgi:LPS sulfotransferase NodH